MNMHLKQCFARAKPFRLKKRPDFDWYFDLKKKPSTSKKAWISKFGFKNAKLATLHMTSDYMRPPLLGEVAVASQGQVFDHRNWARKFIQSVLWFSCNSWRIWFYLTNTADLFPASMYDFQGSSFPVSTLSAAPLMGLPCQLGCTA